MRKLALGLLTAGAVTVAHADANAWNGFYLGVHSGLGSITSKMNHDSFPAPGTQAQRPRYDSGKGNFVGGFQTGYGTVFNGNGYAATELYMGFDSTNIIAYDDSDTPSIRWIKTTIESNNYYGLAVRLGYLFSPSVLGYVRLAGDFGKVTVETTDLSINKWGSIKKSEGGVFFSPGLGLETVLTKNVLLRFEYTYTFVPRLITDKLHSGPSGTTGDDVVTSLKPIKQAFRVGVSYKF